MFKCHFGDLSSRNQERTLGGLSTNIPIDYLRYSDLQQSKWKTLGDHFVPRIKRNQDTGLMQLRKHASVDCFESSSKTDA